MRCLRLGQPAFEQHAVAHMCLESKIKQVAEKRDCAHDCIDGEVQQHASQHCYGRAELTPYQNAVRANERSEQVSSARDQPENRIEAETPARARHTERLIE